MPDGVAAVSRDVILRYEEFLRICRLTAGLGVASVKVTGGEPLARKGCVNFLMALKSTPGLERVTLTTNGVLLEPYIEALAGMGLDGVNISLDSLDPETYARITGADEFSAVWRSLQAAIKAELRVKVNCVPIRGLNDMEITGFARLAECWPVDVRFIEFMPTEAGERFRGLPDTEILDRLYVEYPDLVPDSRERGSGPARYFSCAKMKGAVGLISATSRCFCAACNRIRVTSEGFLKLCLYHDGGLDLRGLIRDGARDDEIESAIVGAVMRKPERHFFGDRAGADAGMGIKKMSRIGG